MAVRRRDQEGPVDVPEPDAAPKPLQGPTPPSNVPVGPGGRSSESPIERKPNLPGMDPMSPRVERATPDMPMTPSPVAAGPPQPFQPISPGMGPGETSMNRVNPGSYDAGGGGGMLGRAGGLLGGGMGIPGTHDPSNSQMNPSNLIAQLLQQMKVGM